MQLRHILETCLYVDNLDAAEDFYGGVLGLPKYSRQDNGYLFYRLSRGMLLLFLPEYGKDATRGVPAHGTEGAGHLAFAVAPSEFPKWRRHLQKNGITIETERTWLGGGSSLYFRDPAGNVLELATPNLWGYPNDKFLAEE